MSGTCRLTVQPEGKTVAVESGTSVLQALQQLETIVRNDCGGAGVCGKCRVLVEDGNGLSQVGTDERKSLGEVQVHKGYRLACLATVTGDTTVVVPQATDAGDRPRGKEIQGAVCSPDPSVSRIFLDADRISPVPAAAQLSRLLLERLPGWHDFPADEAGEQLASLLVDCRKKDGVTLVVHEQQGVAAVLPGHQIAASLGLAVDLGTTTLAGYLCDLQSGEQLASGAVFNPQRKYGDDVISRISSAVDSDADLKDMQRRVAEAINQLADQCLADCGFTDDSLDEIVVVGNTTMQTIFVGDSPESLGVAPYLPKTLNAHNLPAKSLGLKAAQHANVYIFPVISGFLGGDSVAAALGGDLRQQAEPRLIIDIGTNGELLLGCGEQIVATSCATGPALEGAAISCGMRAVAGAIDRVEVDEEQNCLHCHSLGMEEGVYPKGICGSGLIDVMACLRQLGVLEESGRMNVQMKGVIRDESGMGQAYTLVSAEQNGSGENLVLTQADVRAFQLAKSALVVGIEKLLEWYNLEEVPYTCITGAFGAHFNWRNGLAVDLLPAKVARGEVCSGANLAGAGAMMALLNRKKRKEAEELAASCKALELAADPDFNLRFVERTKFPVLKN